MPEKFKTISVIIPTYGRPDNLDRAIKSVINQTYNQWELIIVDDNDPNSEGRICTEQVMLKYSDDTRIRYIKHEKNKNGSAARNTGIRVATGDIVSFLDDDDEYVDCRFEKCMMALNEFGSDTVGGVYTGCIFYRNNRKYRTISKAPSGNFLKETLATTFQSHSGSNIFMPRSIVNELNGFDESFIRHQDYEFFARFFERYSLVGINEALLVKHENGQNLPNIEKMYNTKIQYLNKFKYLIEGLSEKEQKQVYYSQYIALAHMAEELRDKKLAKKYYIKAKEYKNISLVDYLRSVKAALFN